MATQFDSMSRQKIPFIQGEAPGSLFPINLFFLKEGYNGRDAMVGTPGLTTRVSTLLNAPVRALQTDKNRTYLCAVVGSKVYIIDTSWNVVEAVNTLDTNTGFAHIAANLTQIMIVDGVKGYIVSDLSGTPTVTEITDADFVTPSSLAMQDSYFIVSQSDSFNFQISALEDGTDWNATDIGTVEGNADNISTMLSDHRQLFMFGPKSIEVFYNSGDATFPFERYPDIYIEDGIGAVGSTIATDNSVFYLNNDFILKRLDGFTPKVAGPPRLHQVIDSMTTKSDAICFSYSSRGCVFLVMQFPTEDVTYVLNLATGFVHQWASGASQGRHRSNCHAFFNGKHIVGDYENGKLYSLEDEVYTDAGTAILWTYTSPHYELNNLMLFHKELVIDFATNVGLVAGQGSDPTVMLKYSDNAMSSWSSERWRNLGVVGEYKKRVRWTGLGGSRSRYYQISGSDPVKRMFSEAALDIEVGNG